MFACKITRTRTASGNFGLAKKLLVNKCVRNCEVVQSHFSDKKMFVFYFSECTNRRKWGVKISDHMPNRNGGTLLQECMWNIAKINEEISANYCEKFRKLCWIKGISMQENIKQRNLENFSLAFSNITI